MNVATLSAALGLIITISGGTYYVVDKVAWKDDLVAWEDDLMVVASKADYALDKQMEYTLTRINALEQKAKDGKATQYDLEQLRYHREELKRLRALRRGG